MSEQNISADKVRKIINDMYRHAALLEALLPPPSRPTLAEMTDEERESCQWMQADVEDGEISAVILNPYWEDGSARLLWPGAIIEEIEWEKVTPRYDLPRFEWPIGQIPDVGTVIESADDPRIAALPVGSILRDCDGETVNKRDEAWVGLGFIPNPEEGDDFGPWTVAQLPKKPAPAPAPALPGRWRFAEHPDHGCVIVTRPTQDSEGNVLFVIPSTGHLGHKWRGCKPDELTYIDQEA